MSFSRGFNSGFSMVLDAKRLRMQEDEIQRQRERDEREDRNREDLEFGYYTDASGGRVAKEDAVIMDDSGTVTGVKDGFNFVQGEAKYRSTLTELKQEELDEARFRNDPRMRAMVTEAQENQLKNSETIAAESKLNFNVNRTITLNTELEAFFSEYDSFLTDPDGWKSTTDVEKDMFSQDVASKARSIYERYGKNPLDLFLDANVPGYSVAGELQNMISKNPDIIESLNLADYDTQLNSLFNLQTKNFIGKKFEGNGVSGTVKNVDLDFSNYKLDARNNTLILKARYEVETEDGTQIVNGVLNDTNRNVIRPDISESDEIAFSLNDLIDYTSAGASIESYMTDPKFTDFVKQAKNDAITYANMFPDADVKGAAKIRNQAEIDFAAQKSAVVGKFQRIDADIIYPELYAKRNAFGVNEYRDERNLVNTMVNNFPDHMSYLEETDDENYELSGGLRIKRDDDGNLMPLYKLHQYGMKSKEEIYNSYVRGDANIFTDEIAITYRFDNLENDLNDQMSLSVIEDELGKINPRAYNKIEAVLRDANLPVTAKNVLDLAKRLNDTGNL
tara:strand:+ start:276 stop:1961 length:1686 start_codon:yes stop_codon:yes gene_type:complete